MKKEANVTPVLTMLKQINQEKMILRWLKKTLSHKHEMQCSEVLDFAEKLCCVPPIVKINLLGCWTQVRCLTEVVSEMSHAAKGNNTYVFCDECQVTDGSEKYVNVANGSPHVSAMYTTTNKVGVERNLLQGVKVGCDVPVFSKYNGRMRLISKQSVKFGTI